MSESGGGVRNLVTSRAGCRLVGVFLRWYTAFFSSRRLSFLIFFSKFHHQVYGAHTSAVDALWAGLPVVTCVGHCGPSDEPSEHTDQMASRVAASLLTAALNNGSRSTITTASLSSIYPSSTTPRTELNSESNSVAEAARAEAARNDALETLITPSLEAYATTMFKLATSPQWYDNLRHQLEESRHTSPLWDAKGYADHFTEGLFEAWHQHLSGNSPRSIRVAAEGS